MKNVTLEHLQSAPNPRGVWGVGNLTLLDSSQCLQNGAVVIEGGIIQACGETRAISSQHPDVNLIDGGGMLCIPGLVNSHVHSAMGFFRGLTHDRPDMIQDVFFPAESKLSAELLEPLAYSYLMQGLRSGVTTFVEHYYFARGVAAAMERLGVRGVVGETIADLGGAFPDGARWKQARQEMETWTFSSRIRPCVAPHAADTVSPDLLRELSDYARRNDLPLHMHLSQDAGERRRVEATHGCTPVELAHQCGALGQNSLLAHVITASPSDLQLIRDQGATIAFCPASQIIFAKLAPIRSFLELGIPVAVATDAAASNDTGDLLQELRLTALLLQDREVPGKLRGPAAVLDMATVNPHRCMGQAGCGMIKNGAVADLVFLRNSIENLPATEPATNLIYSQTAANVRHVLVDGRWALWQNEPTGISVADATQAYMAAVTEIRKRAGL